MVKLENEEGLPWTASTGLGWLVLIVALTSGVALLALALYLAVWIRSRGRSALPLYGFLLVSLTSMLLPLLHFAKLRPDFIETIFSGAAAIWIIAIYMLREEIKDHFRETEGWEVSIGPVFTFLFTSLYINYCLNPVTFSHDKTLTSINLSSPDARRHLRR